MQHQITRQSRRQGSGNDAQAFIKQQINAGVLKCQGANEQAHGEADPAQQPAPI